MAELKHKILEELPSSIKNEHEDDVNKYMNEYIKRLKPENVKSGDYELVKRGTDYVLRNIDLNKKNPK